MQIVDVKQGSELLEAVIRLWRPNSASLGFMPRGGFEDAASEGCLLAARDASGDVTGYILFRRNTALRSGIIAHLCVAPAHRGSGIARELLDAMKGRCRDCLDLRLRCRRDFEASGLWPALGFVPVNEEPGRADGARLTLWRLDLEELPLLRLAAAARNSSAVRVAIDANVFFDLDEELSSEPQGEESRSLAAPWLREFVELHVTPELLVEIDRRSSELDRERQRARARTFGQVQRNSDREAKVLPRLKTVLGTKEHSPNDVSDARHLAMTIGAGVSFFVTRDEQLLKAADILYDEFELRVVAPFALVREHDELRRDEEYQPRRLFFGAGARQSAARSADAESIAALIHAEEKPIRRRSSTLQRVRAFLAAPDRYEVVTVSRQDVVLAAYALDRREPRVLSVPLFAFASSSLGKTAGRHFAEALIALAVHERRAVVRFSDVSNRVGETLAAIGFMRDENEWLKLAIPVASTAEGLVDAIESVARSVPSASKIAQQFASTIRDTQRGPGLTRAGAFEVERALWPAKFTASGLPCFVVPIHPRWAADLFDQELALGTLFGAQPEIALSCENVYYRAAHPRVLTGPARVIWYVKRDRAYPQSMALRACSYIHDVHVGDARELFSRYRRLGVYQWSDIAEIAGPDRKKPVMAFRFTNTELLTNAIDWSEFQSVLEAHLGRKNPLQSPLAVPEACFFELYERGTRARAA